VERVRIKRLDDLERGFLAVEQRADVVVGVPLAPTDVFLAKLLRIALGRLRHSAVDWAGQERRERLVARVSVPSPVNAAVRASLRHRVLAEDKPSDEPHDREEGGDEPLAEHPEHRVEELHHAVQRHERELAPGGHLYFASAAASSRHARKDPEVPSARAFPGTRGALRQPVWPRHRDDSAVMWNYARLSGRRERKLFIRVFVRDFCGGVVSGDGGCCSTSVTGPPPRPFSRAHLRDPPRRSLCRRPRLAPASEKPLRDKWRPSPRTSPAARYGAAPAPRSIRAGSRCAARPSARSPLTSPPSLPSQDGYVKWDQVDIDSLKLPAGDDMGIVRYVEAERGSRARDRNPTRWRSTLKRDPKPGAWTFRESNDDARFISPPTKLVVLRPSLDAHVAFLPRHLTRPSSSLSSIHT
jgi:hypothetical protein